MLSLYFALDTRKGPDTKERRTRFTTPTTLSCLTMQDLRFNLNNYENRNNIMKVCVTNQGVFGQIRFFIIILTVYDILSDP